MSERDSDVVVVGSGGAGMMAALRSAVGGAQVTVLKVSGLFGGTSERDRPVRRYRAFGTKGGPVIDEAARILDFDGRPIPGLYGAGNAVAAPFGLAYPGGGGTLAPAVTFGYVAG